MTQTDMERAVHNLEIEVGKLFGATFWADERGTVAAAECVVMDLYRAAQVPLTVGQAEDSVVVKRTELISASDFLCLGIPELPREAYPGEWGKFIVAYDVLQRLLSLPISTPAPLRPENAAALAWLKERMADTSGYDEAVWPRVKATLEADGILTSAPKPCPVCAARQAGPRTEKGTVTATWDRDFDASEYAYPPTQHSPVLGVPLTDSRWVTPAQLQVVFDIAAHNCERLDSLDDRVVLCGETQAILDNHSQQLRAFEESMITPAQMTAAIEKAQNEIAVYVGDEMRRIVDAAGETVRNYIAEHTKAGHIFSGVEAVTIGTALGANTFPTVKGIEEIVAKAVAALRKDMETTMLMHQHYPLAHKTAIEEGQK